MKSSIFYDIKIDLIFVIMKDIKQNNNMSDIQLLTQVEFCEDYNVDDVDESSKTLKILKTNSSNKEVTNIIICVSSGNAYDNAYRNVNEGDGVINNYLIGYEKIQEFYKIIVEKEIDGVSEAYKSLIKDLAKVKSENIMIYFECCSFLQSNKYHFTEKCIELIKYFVLEKKILVLCADFSLKCLINDWNEDVFGKNPFIESDEIKDGTIEIEFNKNKFINSGLKQLKIMGELIDKDENVGNILLKVLEGTISYKIKNVQSEKYSIEILSNVKNNEDLYPKNKKQKINCNSCENINDDFVGQALITFNNGGKLLASNGHFCELCKINYSQENLNSTIINTFGNEYFQKYEEKINNAVNENDASAITSIQIDSLLSQTLSS